MNNIIELFLFFFFFLLSSSTGSRSSSACARKARKSGHTEQACWAASGNWSTRSLTSRKSCRSTRTSPASSHTKISTTRAPTLSPRASRTSWRSSGEASAFDTRQKMVRKKNMISIFTVLETIYYRYDEIKKKLLSWGDILVSLRSWRLQDSRNAGH